MVFSHSYGEHNAEGTFNSWLNTNLTGAGVPWWMPSARVVFDYPETELIGGYSGAAFSVTHLGSDVAQTYQGRNTLGGSAGHTREGLADVSCWISRSEEMVGKVGRYQYARRLRTMADMVTYLCASARDTELLDVYSGTAAPTGIGALVRIGAANEAAVANPDPANPDLFRRRFLVSYRWVERV